MNHLFIGGCGRSGTSLLQDLVTKHSLIAGTSEFNFNNDILHLHRRMGREFFLRRNKTFYTADSLDDSFRLFLDSFLQRVAATKPSASWVAEKTPDNIFVLNDLLRLFPEARFIYVYRDGRDVLHSHLQVRHRSRGSAQELHFGLWDVVRLWNSAAYHRAHAETALQHRILDVQYEALVKDTATQMKIIFDFMQLPAEDVIQKRAEDKGASTMIDDRIWHNSDDAQRPISLAGKDWRANLGWIQRMVANIGMAHYLKGYGYEVPPVYAALNRLIRKRR